MSRQTIFALFITLASIKSAVAQESPQLANEPVFVARFHGWSQSGIREYLQRLNEELQIGTGILAAMDAENASGSPVTLDAPDSGVLVYLAQGLSPSAGQIRYTEIADLDEFRRFVQAEKRKHNDSAVVEGSEDKYRVSVTRVQRTAIDFPQTVDLAISDGDEPTEQVQQTQATSADTQDTEHGRVSIAIGLGPQGVVATSTTVEGEIVKEGNRSFIDQTIHETTWYRYHDGFMFASQSSALWEMRLPSAETLRKDKNGEVGGEIAFFPDRIPMGFRHLGWNAVNTVSGAELQQRDDERDTLYALRRTSGDAGLSLLHAAIFDTQEVSGSMRLGTDNEPIRGELKVHARKNSSLGRSLREFASARSRFAPILNDDAAATLHVAVNLSDDWRTVVAAWRTCVLEEIESHRESQPQLADAWSEIYRSIFGSADHAMFEVILKVGWTDQSGAVIYGGFHVDENPNLLKAIHAMIIDLGMQDESCELVQKGDLQLVQLLVPEYVNPDSLKLTHCCISHTDSCLWFALGGENAYEILQFSNDRIAESSGRVQVPLFTANVDLNQWATIPKDDPTGLVELPRAFFLYSEIVAFLLCDAQLEYASAMDWDKILEALQLGGSQELRLMLDADESGLRAHGQLGKGLARAFLAVIIDSLDSALPQIDDVNDSE